MFSAKPAFAAVPVASALACTPWRTTARAPGCATSAPCLICCRVPVFGNPFCSQSADQQDGAPFADRQNSQHRLHLCDKCLPADWESSRLPEHKHSSDWSAKTTFPLVSLPLVGPQQALKRWLLLAALKHHSQ